MNHTTRNTLTARLVPLLLALALVCGAATAQTPLNLLIWSEYIDPAIVDAFEEEFDARVVIDTFESNEDALAKIEAGGLGLYDVVVPSNYIIPTFIELGLLQELDKEIVINLDNLLDTFADPPYDPGNTYTAAYQWGTTGIAYRSDRVDAPTSWGALFADPDAPLALLDDMRPMIGSALLYLGYDYNSEDRDELVEARDLLVDTKNRSLGFYGSPAARNLLLTGDATYAVIYSGEALGANVDNELIDYVIPEEGAEVWVDSVAVVADAPNPELANEFINYILRPEVGAQLTNYITYASPNAAALPMVDEELRDNEIVFPSDETRERLVFTQQVDNLELYDLVWTQIKAR
ncbi:MAG: spermidine/putrescine ABC transporter substrate-binding protein [Trueperaceae bacterium]|nr:spermidine/putrescine ABC transporter substrate-binding protein [Trueperaceae bacterium]